MATVTRQVGTVSAVDADKVQARVRLPECDNLRTHWLNVLQRNTQNNKDYWLPDIGEQVEVLLDANGEDGVILGAVYSSVDKPPFSDKNVRGTVYADGAEFSYNRETHTLIVRGGIDHIRIECQADVTVKTPKATIDAPETEITGNLMRGAWQAPAEMVLLPVFRGMWKLTVMSTQPAACYRMALTRIIMATESF